MSIAKDYEDEVGNLLDILFSGNSLAEVRIRKSLGYGTERGYKSYSPMIDITVGPFSETRGTTYWYEYDRLVSTSSKILDEFIHAFTENYREFGEGIFAVNERNLPVDHKQFLSTNGESVNWNARCFLAIEVEDSGSRKHLLGDLINASISGRVGIVIGFNEDRYQALFRQLDYLAYTVEAKKIKFNSRNILVLKPNQFRTILLDNLLP